VLNSTVGQPVSFLGPPPLLKIASYRTELCDIHHFCW
jgi:hypothetical protein